MSQYKIFISLVALLEEELIPTIKDLLEQAMYPHRLHFSIVVQDDHNPIRQISSLIPQYGFGLSYKLLPLEECRGVGYARSLAIEPLTTDFEYYLQLDAHSRAKQHWDERIIEWYNKEGWELDERIIYCTYPETYGYVSDLPGDIDISTLKTSDDKTLYYQLNPPGDDSDEAREMIKMVKSEDARYKYKIVRVPWNPDLSARNHQNFCAGFAFGRSEYFLDVLPDPYFSYTGEEITSSIRFLEESVKIIEPYENLFYHDYQGHKYGRRPSWFVESDPKFAKQMERIPFVSFEQESHNRLAKFFNGELDDSYAARQDTIELFFNTYVKD